MIVGAATLATGMVPTGLPNTPRGMSEIDHPWEESRGMGVSYGSNRAEDLGVYHTGRELVFIVVDTMSRAAVTCCSTLAPTRMEPSRQRLKKIGDWMTVNGGPCMAPSREKIRASGRLATAHVRIQQGILILVRCHRVEPHGRQSVYRGVLHRER